jgi:hypothetical protein
MVSALTRFGQQAEAQFFLQRSPLSGEGATFSRNFTLLFCSNNDREKP